MLKRAEPVNPTPNASILGILYALGCFGLWGVFPIYFKALGHVPAIEVLAHRIVWSAALLGTLILMTGQQRVWIAELSDLRKTVYYVATTLLIATNWLIYVWAVQHSRILETSLGYFINPLVSVVLGVLFLHERLSARQGVAVGLAAAGVLILVTRYGDVPWIALVLAVSFGSYGLLRKKAGVNALLSLFLETVLMVPLALGYLLALATQGGGAFGRLDRRTDLLLALAGVVTVIPLSLFIEATQRLRLATVGLMQYLAPTLQFALAVGLYHELLTTAYLLTFACIWTALAIYSYDAISAHRATSMQ